MHLNLPVLYNLKFFFPVCDPSLHPKQPQPWSVPLFTLRVRLHEVMLVGWFQHQNSEVFGVRPGCCIGHVGSENELAGNLLWSTGKSKILGNIKINWRWSTTPRLSRGQAISQHGLPPFFISFFAVVCKRSLTCLTSQPSALGPFFFFSLPYYYYIFLLPPDW